MNISEVKARHEHVEGQTATQSVELMAERRSKAHKDRGWLIEQLESALEQNERLAGELDVLGAAVEEIRPKKVRRKKEAA